MARLKEGDGCAAGVGGSGGELSLGAVLSRLGFSLAMALVSLELAGSSDNMVESPLRAPVWQWGGPGSQMREAEASRWGVTQSVGKGRDAETPRSYNQQTDWGWR